jgi:VWFA-related protein
MKATIACGFLLIGFLISAVAFASEGVSFRITQASVQLPTITTWLDITNEKGQKIDALKPEQLSATVGSYPAEVKEIKPFSELNKGTSFIFLIDISQSLKTQAFEQLQAALKTWVDGMREHDRAALISFGSQVKVLQDFSADKGALKQRVDKLAPSDKDTFLYQGLVQAFELGRRQDADLPKRRVIVVLTDGIDDAAGGVTKEEVFLQMPENRIPIYAIGFAMAPLTQDKENGLKELGVLARTSGGHFLKADSMPLTKAYALQKERIVNSYELHLLCNACKAEGQLS